MGFWRHFIHNLSFDRFNKTQQRFLRILLSAHEHRQWPGKGLYCPCATHRLKKYQWTRGWSSSLLLAKQQHKPWTWTTRISRSSRQHHLVEAKAKGLQICGRIIIWLKHHWKEPQMNAMNQKITKELKGPDFISKSLLRVFGRVKSRNKTSVHGIIINIWSISGLAGDCKLPAFRTSLGPVHSSSSPPQGQTNNRSTRSCDNKFNDQLNLLFVSIRTLT